MAKRYPNHRLVKRHRCYSVEEIADLLGKHKNTVRAWMKKGLAVIDNQRPMLIHGYDLITFLKKQRGKNKQHCKPGELYCVRCRAPKYPAENMADYSPVTDKFGNLKAICPDCNSIMNRRVSWLKIKTVCENLDVSFPKDQQHITETFNPSVNSDLRKGEQDHEKTQPGQ